MKIRIRFIKILIPIILVVGFSLWLFFWNSDSSKIYLSEKLTLSFQDWHSIEIFFIQNPSLSPDGTKLTFDAAWKKRFPFGPLRFGHHIFVIELDTMNIKQIPSFTSGKINNSKPVWFPSGQHIAFQSNRLRKEWDGLWIMNGNGLEQKLLTGPIGHHLTDIQCSPDGTMVGLTSTNGKDVLLFIDVASGEKKQLISDMDKGYSSWRWSGDSKKIFFVRGGDIWVVNTDGNNPQRIFADGERWYLLDLSPDGKEMLIVCSSSNRRLDLLAKLSIDDLSKQNLVTDKHLSYEASWSPDGNQIIFVERHPDVVRGKNKQPIPTQIWIMGVDGKNQKKLTHDLTNLDKHPIILSDNRGIVFIRNLNTIWMMDMDGSDQRQIFIRQQDYKHL